jgi:hypothetical protein
MHFNKIKKQGAWEEMGNFEKILLANVVPNFIEQKWIA